MVYEVRRFSFSAISWKKVGLGLLFVFGTVAAAGIGYASTALWQRYLVPQEEDTKNKYAGWQVYFNDQYNLGLRYPEDWKVSEVAKEFVVFTKETPEGAEAPRDYLTLEVKAAGNRPSTDCENNQLSCSFYANGIYGEKITTPETETVFFSKSGNDFNFVLHKYGDADFSKTFEEMSQSLRFVTDEDNQGSGS